jgi:hypothetical protein
MLILTPRLAESLWQRKPPIVRVQRAGILSGNYSVILSGKLLNLEGASSGAAARRFIIISSVMKKF